MIFILMGLVAGAMLGLKWANPKKFMGYLGGAAVALGIGILGAIIGGFIAMGVGTFLPTEYVEKTQIELVALEDDNIICEKFFLRYEISEGRLFYAFRKKEKDGTIKSDKLIVGDNKVKIYEEERKDGLMIVFEKDLIKKVHHLFGIPDTRSPRYKIYVPKGSVSRKLELDLE